MCQLNLDKIMAWREKKKSKETLQFSFIVQLFTLPFYMDVNPGCWQREMK